AGAADAGADRRTEQGTDDEPRPIAGGRPARRRREPPAVRPGDRPRAAHGAAGHRGGRRAARDPDPGAAARPVGDRAGRAVRPPADGRAAVPGPAEPAHVHRRAVRAGGRRGLLRRARDVPGGVGGDVGRCGV
ncbi:MAG: hypothetical protein AVDCRST_MAG64-4308, partial [uncultured Phycisphaerae bacterium]